MAQWLYGICPRGQKCTPIFRSNDLAATELRAKEMTAAFRARYGGASEFIVVATVEYTVVLKEEEIN